jgi:hypothetical protein
MKLEGRLLSSAFLMIFLMHATPDSWATAPVGKIRSDEAAMAE